MKFEHLPSKVKNVFEEAVFFLDNPKSRTSNPIISGIQKEPLSLLKQEMHAQFFTPADVAIYCAIEVYRKEPQPVKAFDPCLGMGGLLIASGFILSEQFSLRDNELLNNLGGNEIDPDTRSEGIENIYESLKEYLPNLSKQESIAKLKENISCLDANDLLKDSVEQSKVIMNPPYKETGKGNHWIGITSHILSLNPSGFSFILPVSISSSTRAEFLRDKIKSDYLDLKALHHEIRPRPLFKGVEQRITIISGDREGENTYDTTGFLTHKARERASVWNSPTTKHNISSIHSVFPKVSPADLDYYDEVLKKEIRKTITEYQNERLDAEQTEVWVRTTGRYKLFAQKEQPATESSKWKKITIPSHIESKFLSAFNDGDLLHWWKIFGDGRDISIRSIKTEYAF